MTHATATLDIQQETPAHGTAIDTLLNDAFGPGRFAKTAERLREGNQPIAELCLAAFVEDVMKASVRFWPITVGADDALLLGPLAVDPTCRGQGIGIALMQEALTRAKDLGHHFVILVGDEPYYARVGFAKAAQGTIVLPGPVDPVRVLWLDLMGHSKQALIGEARVPQC